MKFRNFIRVVIAVALVGIGIWWFTRSTTVALEKTAGATMPVRENAPKPVAPPQIAKPLAPVAQVKTEMASQPSVSTNATPDSADPQADLKTALPDIVRLQRTGDLVKLYQTYLQPNRLTPEFMQQLLDSLHRQQDSLAQADPDLQQRLLRIRQQIQEEAAQDVEDLESQTPTYNDAGDEATYVYTPRVLGEMSTEQEQKKFIKINGKWYLK